MDQGGETLLDRLGTSVDSYFDQLVLSYGAQLYTFALRWSGNPSDAEDIVQLAFERAFLALRDYSPTRIRTLNMRPWLYKITLNVARNYTSRSRLQAVSLDLPSENDSPLEIEDAWQNQPEAIAEEAERRRELEALVAALAPSYRDAISLCFFGDLSYQETATLLHKSVGTIKFYVHRGVKLLRATLEQQTNEIG